MHSVRLTHQIFFTSLP